MDRKELLFHEMYVLYIYIGMWVLVNDVVDIFSMGHS